MPSTLNTRIPLIFYNQRLVSFQKSCFELNQKPFTRIKCISSIKTVIGRMLITWLVPRKSSNEIHLGLYNRKDSCRIVLVIVVVIVHVSICLYWQSITCCVSCTSYFGFFRTLALFCVNFMGESSWPLLCKVSCTKTYLCIRTNGF